jgi:hypothetical protein
MKASGKGAQVYFRPVACELSAKDTSDKVRDAASTEVVDDAIIAELDEAREQGRRFDELKSMFMKQAGGPLLLDAETLPYRVRSLCASGEIVLELEKRLYDKSNPAREILDEMRLYLAQYGPSASAGVVITSGKEVEKVAPEQKVAYERASDGAGAAVTEEQRVDERVTVLVASQEHTTPFKMITELEGRLASDDKVTSVTISLRGKAMDEAGNLEQLLADFKSRKGISQIELSVKLWMPRAMAKDDLMKLLGKLPLPSEGTIKATLEVEKHESE